MIGCRVEFWDRVKLSYGDYEWKGPWQGTIVDAALFPEAFRIVILCDDGILVTRSINEFCKIKVLEHPTRRINGKTNS